MQKTQVYSREFSGSDKDMIAKFMANNKVTKVRASKPHGMANRYTGKRRSDFTSRESIFVEI